MTRRALVAAGAVAIAAAVSLPSFLVPRGVRAADTPAARAAAYLATRQGADGSVPDKWRPDQVAEAIVALAAGGGQSGAVDRAVGFLQETANAGASSGPYAGRIVAGLVVAGKDPRRFAGVDFVARTESYLEPVSGSYGGNLYGDALAMLGLQSAGRRLPDSAINRLRVNQCRDGGWAYQTACAGKPDTDTTSMALSVLAATLGAGATEVRSARSWLLANQTASGCWGHDPGSPDNANSCGLALSAIAAIGERPDAAAWTRDGRDAVAALQKLQLPSGAFQYRADVAGPNDYATVQAAPALAGWSYPVRAPAPAQAPPGAGATSTTARPPADDDAYEEAGGAPPEPTTATTAPASASRSAPRPAPRFGITTTRTGDRASTTSTSAGRAKARSIKTNSAPSSESKSTNTTMDAGDVFDLSSGSMSRSERANDGDGEGGVSLWVPAFELLTLAVVIATFRWRWKMRAARPATRT